MADGKFVAYYRVSTQRQGASGLGLAAQRAGVAGYLNGGAWELIGEFTETESGKGSNALTKRPQLAAALKLAEAHGATLIIAKLDRLARNVHFVSGLLESKCNFVAADMPAANKTMLQIYAVMAEWERDQISKRTKEALMAAKKRGVKVGAKGHENLRSNIAQRQQDAQAHAETLRPMLAGLIEAGRSQREILSALNAAGTRSSKGSSKWTLAMVQRVLARLNLQTKPKQREDVYGSW